jgi:hypothetical protein
MRNSGIRRVCRSRRVTAANGAAQAGGSTGGQLARRRVQGIQVTVVFSVRGILLIEATPSFKVVLDASSFFVSSRCPVSCIGQGGARSQTFRPRRWH